MRLGDSARGAASFLCLASILACSDWAWAQNDEQFEDKPRLSHLNLFHRRPPEEKGPLTPAELGKKLDHVAESIRNDGLVVLKQPDPFSQARMTKYRREFDKQMSQELDKFKVILAGRVLRVDGAALSSQTSLGAALGKPGMSVTVPNPPLPTAPDIDLNPRFVPTNDVGQDTLKLGLEPTIVLDEQKRYLDQLGDLRRVNLGNDLADSAGYGIYLIRMPISITPGEHTRMGYGAEIEATVTEEFPPDFLRSTFRNLVVNDLVELLGPPLYEKVRQKTDAMRRIKELQTKLDALCASYDGLSEKLFESLVEKNENPDTRFIKTPGETDDPPDPSVVRKLARYLIRAGVDISGLAPPKIAAEAVGDRLHAMLDVLEQVNRERLTKQLSIQRDLEAKGKEEALNAEDLQTFDSVQQNIKVYKRFLEGVPKKRTNLDASIQASRLPVPSDGVLNTYTAELYEILTYYYYEKKDNATLVQLLRRLYESALPNDVSILDDALGVNTATRVSVTSKLASTHFELAKAMEEMQRLSSGYKSTHLSSNRNPKRSYPIAPRELDDFFLPENLEVLAGDIEQGRVTDAVRATDVRNYLRQQLSIAYDAMSLPSPKLSPPTPPVSFRPLLDSILGAVQARAFAPGGGPSPLRTLNKELMALLPANLEMKSLGALCWAIAIDAVLLDDALRRQAKSTFEANNLPCPDWAFVRFYEPVFENEALFREFVSHRWPVVSFALDPVTDQQNIIDSFSLSRDLQLALAFAFSTGQINFNQLNSFRRKIQQDSETIALNSTVSAFAHSNDTFGWRFTPRMQNPPSQNNLQTIASTLINGGPGQNYGLKKSKLEAGQRELTAVIILPSFVPTVRFESSGNWFRLDDPEHLKVHTSRMLEQGGKVQELRQRILEACSSQRYRAGDVRFLQTKLRQIDAMLPIQSQLVALPFDNSATGFDLFNEGTTALAPELSGFEGADAVVKGKATDLLLFGRFISITETQIVAGGRLIIDDKENVNVDILSREVLRIRIPADVAPTKTQDGGLFVEIHLATPNGISNSVFVPYREDEGREKPEPKPTDDPTGTKITTVEITEKEYPPKGETPTKPADMKTKAPGASDPAKPPTSQLPKSTKPTPKTKTTSVPRSVPSSDDFDDLPPLPDDEAPTSKTIRTNGSGSVSVVKQSPGLSGLANRVAAEAAAAQAGVQELPELPVQMGSQLPARWSERRQYTSRVERIASCCSAPAPVVVVTPGSSEKKQSSVLKHRSRLFGSRLFHPGPKQPAGSQ